MDRQLEYHFNFDDAMKYGVEEAVILYNIRFWIRHNQANEKHFHEGHYWTFNSQKAFSELFPFWSRIKIQRLLKKLEDDGAIIVGNFNRSAYDRTKWYAISGDGELDKKPEQSIVQNRTIEDGKLNNRLLKSEQPIPDNKTQMKNTDINKKTSCSKLKFETKHMVLAELLQKKMKENNPNLKPQNLKSWANTFRLMMERDNRSFDDIKKVVLWCQQDSFWYKNILSADKLRKQYDRLTLEMKNPRGGRRNGNSEEDKYKNDLGYQWHLKNPGMPWRTTAERHAGIPAHY